MIVKVFDISDEVVVNEIDDTQKSNIIKIFSELTKETHLITNCYLDIQSINYQTSPIYYFKETSDKKEFEYKRIAEDLLKAECKTDGTRNITIREGLLFVKADNDSLTIMKLEKLEVIDKETYEIKSELGKEKDYFKVCTFKGDYDDIKIIDKNKTAAKYWYQTFLGLTRQRTHEDNTQDVINLVLEDTLFDEEIVQRGNYSEVKRFTEFYLFDNKKFDKSDLFNELNSSGLIGLKREDELFSDESKKIDSDFNISEKVVNNTYQRTIQTSPEITIKTKNYLESLRDSELIFNEKDKTIKIIIDEEYLPKVKEKLESE